MCPCARPAPGSPIFSEFPLGTTFVEGSTTNRAAGQRPAPLTPRSPGRASGPGGECGARPREGRRPLPAPPRSLHPLPKGVEEEDAHELLPPLPGGRSHLSPGRSRGGVAATVAPLGRSSGRSPPQGEPTGAQAPLGGERGAGRRGRAAPGELAGPVSGRGLGRALPWDLTF